MSYRSLIAFVLGAGLLTVLPYLAYPLSAQGAEVGRSYLLGFGGPALAGAAIVFIAGRPQEYWLLRLPWFFWLCVLCSLVGAIVYVAGFVVPRFGGGLVQVVPSALLTFVQFSVPALVGAWLADMALGSGASSRHVQ